MPIVDLSGLEVQRGPYPFTPREPFPFEIYLFFIQSIRDADKAEGELLLLRWLEQMQEEWEEAYARIYGLLGLYDVEMTSLEALGHVKWLTGLSAALDFLTGGLSEAELRRLTSVAVKTWKSKGTEAGLQEVLQTVLVDEVRIDNWFRFRTLLYEWELGWADDPGADLWLTDRPEMPTSVKPDAVAWDGAALRFDLTSLLENLELLSGGLNGTPRTVRILCVPSRRTAEGTWTTDAEGNLSASVAGDMSQATPSTDPDDYRAGTDPDEFSSDVRLADNGGVVNRALVEGLVTVLRPSLERLFVRYVTFMDSFRRTPDWVTESGGAVFDVEAGTAELYDAAQVSYIRTDEPGDLTWEEYLARAQFRLAFHDYPFWGELRFCVQDELNFFSLNLSPTVGNGATFGLHRMAAGVRSIIEERDLPAFFPGVDYMVHVDVEGTHFQCFLDGNLLIDVSSYDPGAGRVGLACAAGQRMTATYVEVMPKPMTTVRIGPPMSTG